MEQTMAFRRGLLWSSIIVVIMLALSAYAWVVLPADVRIPTHWGISGQPDAYGGKAEGLLLLPAISAGLALLLFFIARVEPRQRHIRLSATAYMAIWLAVLGLMAVIHAFAVMTALGIALDINIVLPIALGVLFVIIGNYFGKLRSNFFAGIRTPWTLSSDLAWDKTHRFGGKLFVLLGVIFILSALFRAPILFFYLLMGELLLVTVLLTVYSYFAWRGDPNKRNSGEGNNIAAMHPGNDATLRVIAVTTVVLVLGLAVAFALGAYRVQPSVNLTERTQYFVQAMARGDYQAAERDFDNRMRTALPPSGLRNIWDGLIQQHGAFQRIETMRTVASWPYTQVFVTSRFERAAVTMRVVYNRTGMISGLWFVNVVPIKER